MLITQAADAINLSTPILQAYHKTANIQDGARLDISVNGFWGGRYEKCYIDVRVFNPFAPSNSGSSLQSCYRKHESVKKRVYEVRVREVEHSSFTPLVFAATGGINGPVTKKSVRRQKRSPRTNFGSQNWSALAKFGPP